MKLLSSALSFVMKHKRKAYIEQTESTYESQPKNFPSFKKLYGEKTTMALEQKEKMLNNLLG